MAHILQRSGVEVFHQSYDRPGIGMSDRRGALNDQFLGDAVGLILSLALLVLNNAALHVEPSLVDGTLEMPHPAGLDPQGDIQRVGGNILEKIGAVFAGGAIQVRRANPFHRLKKCALIRAPLEMLAAGEHKMLKQVGETGLARLLIL